MKISAVVLTRNDEKYLEKCLKSLSWCDELVVVDDKSTDATMAIAKKYNANIYIHNLSNNFSQQRNFGLEKATNDWILFIDSDEVVGSQLKNEIQEKMQNSLHINGYFIKREDTLFGKKLLHGETGNMWLLRLAKKNAGKWQGTVHEIWEIHGKKGYLKNTLDHFPHPTVNDFLMEINTYSTIRAEQLYRNHVQVNLSQIILYPTGKFFVNYFLKLGFLDGVPGFLVAMLMSLHSFLVRGKLWQLQSN